MSQELGIDTHTVRRYASALRDSADELHERRADLMDRLTTGAAVREVERVKDNVKVTIGASDYQHTGSEAGDLVATKLKSCGDGYTAVEDGLRAMATMMSTMAEALERGDEVNATDLNTALSSMHCVMMAVDGQEPEQANWFGLESA